MYQLLAPQVSLSQGDILADCPIVTLDPPAQIDVAPQPRSWMVRVVILTQACDLAQAKTERIVVALVHPAADLVAEGLLKASLIREQIRRHQVFGWYFLPAATAPVSVPESLIDLRDVHSVPRVVLEQLIKGGKRVASLVSPYREHLAQHFAVTYMRVALPEPYATQP